MIDSGLGAWVDACLHAAVRTRTGDLTLFRERAWATVYSAPTDAGTVWVKASPPDTAFEAALYEVLADVVPEHVLVPLGTDLARGWLLLPDGGPSAADRRGREDVSVLEKALPVYAELQQRLAPHADRLLAAGVVDLRPPALPAAFDRALDAVLPYVRERADVDERADYDRLLSCRDEYASWCAELGATGRPASLDHNDLHAGNVLDGNRFYDWGDAVLAHPFACLLTPLHGVPDAHAARLRDAYLAAWGDPVALRAEADLAVRVAHVPRALVWHRAIAADPLGHEHAGAPLSFLRKLISQAP